MSYEKQNAKNWYIVKNIKFLYCSMHIAWIKMYNVDGQKMVQIFEF
jgi:hypothetical protein